MSELWKDIDETNGTYRVSDKGIVQKYTDGKYISLRTYLDSGGYERVYIGKRTHAVHRLVAKAFIPNPYNYPVVHHIDENKRNNNRSNLLWCTYQQNNMFSAPARSAKNAKKKYVVVQMDLDGNVLAEWNTFQEAKRALGISDAAMIGKCAHGIRKTAHGYKWGLRYKDDVLQSRQSRIERKRYAQELFEEAFSLSEETTIQELYIITQLCKKRK